MNTGIQTHSITTDSQTVYYLFSPRMAQDKERQGLQLRHKLDEMKRRRGQKQEAEFVEIIELQEK